MFKETWTEFPQVSVLSAQSPVQVALTRLSSLCPKHQRHWENICLTHKCVFTENVESNNITKLTMAKVRRCILGLQGTQTITKSIQPWSEPWSRCCPSPRQTSALHDHCIYAIYTIIQIHYLQCVLDPMSCFQKIQYVKNHESFLVRSDNRKNMVLNFMAVCYLL
jgi:hypothetical protein